MELLQNITLGTIIESVGYVQKFGLLCATFFKPQYLVFVACP